MRSLCYFLFAVVALYSAAAAAQPVPGSVLRDCPDCPEMVMVPAGRFTMGSPDGEIGRERREDPSHTVTFAQPFAVGKFEVTRAEYARFVSEAGYPTGGDCWHFDQSKGAWKEDAAKNWSSPGFAQEGSHPVVCVSWQDAKAYVAWLSKKTGKAYRLLSEAEWEYAARAGSTTSRPWGDDPNAACQHANVQDRVMAREVSAGPDKKWPNPHDCDDGHAFTAPVGKFRVNAFGLHDMIGNVWELTEDCSNTSYDDSPTDGSPWTSGNCRERVARGGSWYSVSSHTRSAYRYKFSSGIRYFFLGFRLARSG